MNLTTKDVFRFWSKVDIRSEDECWPWISCRDKFGYGIWSIGRKRFRAPRVALFLSVGDLGDSICMHHCDNPPCCNPRHLKKGTVQENVADKVAKGRHCFGPEHAAAVSASCKRGDESFPRKHRERMAKGEAHGMAKLTDDAVRQIRIRCATKKKSIAILLLIFECVK